MEETQYKIVKARLEKGDIAISEAGGFLKAPQHWLKAFQQLAEQALTYEVDHDLLSI